MATAAIATQPASIQTLTHTHTVPGRLEYDASRRLQLRLPVECVVKQVLVRPGQYVLEGAKLAVLSSKQVGLARDAVQQCEEDLSLARHQLQWHDRIATNVGDLLSGLSQMPQMSDLEEAYQDRPLGIYRREILAAYSDFLLAKQIQQDSVAISEQGVLSGRTVKERRNALERSRATFHSVCEETRNEVSVEKQTAQISVARAERALKISAEQFASLLGQFGTNDSASGGALSEFVLTAPFAGRIEDRHIMPAAVVAANTALITLANTDHLWVSAQIHERNWQAASAAPGKTVRVRTPATGDREFTATIEFVGAVVDPETHALPLIAKIDNADHLLKPGMFVWVTVPVEPPRETLAVRTSAVMRHEGQAFVFVADAADTFRRVDITTGLETENWIEIQDGLVGGEDVAATGAFALKSELLLEREGI
jgi:cobalt-zinc-cadmium efflux system membrane fusion protein